MEPVTFFFPVFYTIILWWFSTGIIMAAFGRSPMITRSAFLGASVILLIALWTLVESREGTSVREVYLAASSGVIIWGWQLTGYYLGFVTGPQGQPKWARTDLPGWQRGIVDRFRTALYFSIYHELLTAAFAVMIAVVTWSSPNRWGLWMYLALWLMHSSAKLNVFFGVRNFRMEFLPEHFHHLGALVSRRQYNVFLPVSVILASSITLTLFYLGVAPGTDDAQRVGYLILATMMSLGVLEHCLLVLPIPAALWGWGLRSLDDETPPAKQKRSDPESTNLGVRIGD